jgi:hypothetical protein
MHDGKATQSPEATVPDTGLTIRQYYVMVGIGAFVTTIAQPAVIGRLPFSLLLKNQLHFNAETLALFRIAVLPLSGDYVSPLKRSNSSSCPVASMNTPFVISIRTGSIGPREMYPRASCLVWRSWCLWSDTPADLSTHGLSGL